VALTWQKIKAGKFPVLKMEGQARLKPRSERLGQEFADSLTPEFFVGLVDAFFVEVIFPELKKEWRTKTADPRYATKAAKTLGGDVMSRSVGGESLENMGRRKKGKEKQQVKEITQFKDSGLAGKYSALFEDLTLREEYTEDTGVGVRVGPMAKLTRHRMSTYAKADTPNTLWYSVEFGTGSEVASPEWVRHEGETKEEDGSWWYGPTRGKGIHIFGQAGFHMFHEEQTREPRQKWIHLIDTTLKDFIDEYLAKNLAAFEVVK
jgi:hypothetical protein